MARKPERPRTTFCAHHRQGISLSACLKTRIDFEKTCGMDRFCGIIKAERRHRLHQYGEGEYEMKTKNFILVFIVIIMAMILTFTLQCLFSEIAGDFGLSCGMLFLSIFFLFGYKNALMPMERGGFAINMTKRYYQSRDELPKYQKLCKILFIVTISFGTLSFVKGMGNVLFHYVKLFLA